MIWEISLEANIINPFISILKVDVSQEMIKQHLLKTASRPDSDTQALVWGQFSGLDWSGVASFRISINEFN